jgi:hypothetical protein
VLNQDIIVEYADEFNRTMPVIHTWKRTKPALDIQELKLPKVNFEDFIEYKTFNKRKIRNQKDSYRGVKLS